jgi:hypothetical protein
VFGPEEDDPKRPNTFVQALATAAERQEFQDFKDQAMELVRHFAAGGQSPPAGADDVD